MKVKSVCHDSDVTAAYHDRKLVLFCKKCEQPCEVQPEDDRKRVPFHREPEQSAYTVPPSEPPHPSNEPNLICASGRFYVPPQVIQYIKELERTLLGVLMFYRVGPWDEPAGNQWSELMGVEPTTKAMCDRIREVLK